MLSGKRNKDTPHTCSNQITAGTDHCNPHAPHPSLLFLCFSETELTISVLLPCVAMAITVCLRILKYAMIKKWIANAHISEARICPNPIWQLKDLVLQQKGCCGITQLALHHRHSNTQYYKVILTLCNLLASYTNTTVTHYPASWTSHGIETMALERCKNSPATCGSSQNQCRYSAHLEIQYFIFSLQPENHHSLLLTSTMQHLRNPGWLFWKCLEVPLFCFHLLQRELWTAALETLKGTGPLT